ncbi:MAG TPA: hypothetical protein VL574_11360 [Stellaceae bacterium]|jgi:hypothetical protein|nr:hypothetical protein [Stellaceae bacterium]
MVGEETLAARAFVRADHADVERDARCLLGQLPESDTAELEEILIRYAASAERALALSGPWARACLDAAIRRDLFDLLRYGMLHRDPGLSAACGRALINIDRRAQTEASPSFNYSA